MTRGTKLGGGALLLTVVCLGSWLLVGDSSLSIRLRRHLPRVVRKWLAPKPTPSPRMANLPNLYLWAWQRPEDLRFLSEKFPHQKIGVAFLAQTVYLMPSLAASSPKFIFPDSSFFDTARVNIRPRLQPLRVSPDTPLMAVVRIESAHGESLATFPNPASVLATISHQDITFFAHQIATSAQIQGVSALQIDFDATLSEHAFYRDLLIEVRKQLPSNFPLSITALASWCIGDRWLTGLPPGTIDEAVAMFFRMGSGTREVTSYLANGKNFTVPACSTSLGLSTDESFSLDILSGKLSVSDAPLSSLRVYVFSPHAWTETEATPLLKELAP